MSSNQNTIGEFLEKGLGGRSYKATFLLYAINVLLIGLIGYWLVTSYGEQKSFEILPILVGAIISIEYGVRFLHNRVASHHISSEVSGETSANTHSRIQFITPRAGAIQQAQETTAIVPYEFHTSDEPLILTANIQSLNSAYKELINLLENKEHRNKVLRHSIREVFLGGIPLISLLVSIVDFCVSCLYRVVTHNRQIENLQRRVATLENILELERTLRMQEAEVAQISWMQSGLRYAQLNNEVVSNLEYPKRELPSGNKLEIIRDESLSKRKPKNAPITNKRANSLKKKKKKKKK